MEVISQKPLRLCLITANSFNMEISISGTDLVALIDDEDFELVNKYKWKLQDGKIKYARSSNRLGILMHRLLLRLKKGDPDVDHINGNGLDNRKHNLRLANKSQNGANRTKQEESTSKYKGVSFNRRDCIWQVQIIYNQKHLCIGTFKTELEGAIAYNKKALELFGEFAKLNEIP